MVFHKYTFIAFNVCVEYFLTCYTIGMIFRYRRLRGGGVPLILSLAAGDFSVSLFHIMPAYSSFMETWSFGNLGKIVSIDHDLLST